MKFAVFISGNGSNLQAIIDAVASGQIKAELSLVISNKEEAYGLVRAQEAGVETLFVNPYEFESRIDYDQHLVRVLKDQSIDFVVLAGYMLLLSPHFVRAFENRILNVHPALLPDFKGAHAIRDAFAAGVKETGVTIHFVDEEMDHGPIIAQETVVIEERDTLESLEEKIHAVEHRIYPEVIAEFIKNIS